VANQIWPWIGGFFASAGKDRALQLLKNSGLPTNYSKTYNKTLEWMLDQQTINYFLKEWPRKDLEYVKFLEKRVSTSKPVD
jgi:hypothetical protein